MFSAKNTPINRLILRQCGGPGRGEEGEPDVPTKAPEYHRLPLASTHVSSPASPTGFQFSLPGRGNPSPYLCSV